MERNVSQLGVAHPTQLIAWCLHKMGGEVGEYLARICTLSE